MNSEFEMIISSYSDDIRELAKAARQLIYTIFPQVVECLWVKQKTIGYGTGPKKMSEHFCWIMPAKNHVNIGFNYGAELPDPNHILEGTGKMFRHFKVKTAQDLKRADLIDIIKYATTYRVPPVKSE